MEPSISTPTEAWLKKRTVTTRVFSLQIFLLGMEHSVFFLTAWVYINGLVKPLNPNLIFTITVGAYFLSGTVTTVGISKFIDQSRATKKSILICNILVIIGNILYTIHHSHWFLTIGRLIAGAGVPSRAIISSEIARVYTKNEAVPKFCQMGMCYSLGFLIGPTINLVFAKLHIAISTYRVTEANVPGWYMAFFFIILQVIICFFMDDLSKEFDLKGMTENADVDKEKVAADSTSDLDKASDESAPLIQKKKSSYKILWDDIKSLLRVDIIVALSFSFIFMYFVAMFDLVVPLLFVETLRLTLSHVEVYIACLNIVMLSCFLTLIWRKSSTKTLYFMYLLGIFTSMCAVFGIMVVKMYPENKTLRNTLAPFIGICFALACLPESTFLTAALSRMVPSRIQLFAESIRMNFSRLGTFAAVTSVVYIYPYFKLFAIIYGSIVGIGFVVSIVIMKRLYSPSINENESDTYENTKKKEIL